MIHLHDMTGVRATCASEEIDDDASVVLSLGQLREMVRNRDSVVSRLNALRNGVDQHALWIADLKKLADNFCEMSKP